MKVRPSPLLPSTMWSVQVSNTFLEVKDDAPPVPSVVTAPPQMDSSPAARLRFRNELELDPIVSTTRSSSKSASNENKTPVSSPAPSSRLSLEALPVQGTTPVYRCPSSSRTASSSVPTGERYVPAATPTDLSPRGQPCFDQLMQSAMQAALPASPEREASLPSLPSEQHFSPELAPVHGGHALPHEEHLQYQHAPPQYYAPEPPFAPQPEFYRGEPPRESKLNTSFSPQSYRNQNYDSYNGVRRPIKLDGLLWTSAEPREDEPDVQGAPLPPRHRAPPPPPQPAARVSSDEDSDGDESSRSETACDRPSWPENAPRPPPDALHPSLGSAEHEEGTCKRCCFFPRGRCQNGYDCGFCHYDHEKRRRKNKKSKRAAAPEEARVSPHIPPPPSPPQPKATPSASSSATAAADLEQQLRDQEPLASLLGSASDFLLTQLKRDVAERQWAEEQAAAILSKRAGGPGTDYAAMMKMPDNYEGKLVDDGDDTVLGRALKNGRL